MGIALTAGTLADPPPYAAPEPGSYELPAILRVEEHLLLGPDHAPTPLLDLEEGQAALISFVYLSCGETCPLSTATLHRLDRELAAEPELRNRLQLVTVSFDPAMDTPERMAQLVSHLKPKGPWRFLTAANESAIAPVLEDFGQDAVWIPNSRENTPDRLRHVLKIFLVDDTGAVRNIYSTGLLDPRLLVADLRTVLHLP